MLGQNDLKNVQNLTYFVYFFSKPKQLYIYELNFNVWILLSYNFTILHFSDVTLLLPDRAKYLHKWLTAKPQIFARVSTKFELHWNFPYLNKIRPDKFSTINYTVSLMEEIIDMSWKIWY